MSRGRPKGSKNKPKIIKPEEVKVESKEEIKAEEQVETQEKE